MREKKSQLYMTFFVFNFILALIFLGYLFNNKSETQDFELVSYTISFENNKNKLNFLYENYENTFIDLAIENFKSKLLKGEDLENRCFENFNGEKYYFLIKKNKNCLINLEDSEIIEMFNLNKVKFWNTEVAYFGSINNEKIVGKNDNYYLTFDIVKKYRNVEFRDSVEIEVNYIKNILKILEIQKEISGYNLFSKEILEDTLLKYLSQNEFEILEDERDEISFFILKINFENYYKTITFAIEKNQFGDFYGI